MPYTLYNILNMGLIMKKHALVYLNNKLCSESDQHIFSVALMIILFSTFKI